MIGKGSSRAAAACMVAALVRQPLPLSADLYDQLAAWTTSALTSRLFWRVVTAPRDSPLFHVQSTVPRSRLFPSRGGVCGRVRAMRPPCIQIDDGISKTMSDLQGTSGSQTAVVPVSAVRCRSLHKDTRLKRSECLIACVIRHRNDTYAISWRCNRVHSCESGCFYGMSEEREQSATAEQ